MVQLYSSKCILSCTFKTVSATYDRCIDTGTQQVFMTDIINSMANINLDLVTSQGPNWILSIHCVTWPSQQTFWVASIIMSIFREAAET